MFRQSCIYGTRQYGLEDQGWVAWFVIASILGRPLTVFGDGKQTRDLLWIGDLIALYDKAIMNIERSAGQIFNAGGGASNALSLVELLRMLATALGHGIDHGHGSWRTGDQRVFIANCDKAARLLGWTAMTTPAAGVATLIDWVRENRETLEDVLASAAVAS